MATQAREVWLNAFTDAARPIFAQHGFELPDNIRVSVGFSSHGSKGKRIGECWSSASSADQHFEIFITPTMQSQSSRVADVLTHELCHAAVGLDAKHGPRFKAVALAMGLLGPMKATTAGGGWRAWAEPILERLGPLPGADLIGGQSSAPKKQPTRMIKLVCMDCGWTCRTTHKHIDEFPTLHCPSPYCDGKLEQE